MTRARFQQSGTGPGRRRLSCHSLHASLSLALAAMLAHCQSAGPWPSVTVTVLLRPELVV